MDRQIYVTNYSNIKLPKNYVEISPRKKSYSFIDAVILDDKSPVIVGFSKNPFKILRQDFKGQAKFIYLGGSFGLYSKYFEPIQEFTYILESNISFSLSEELLTDRSVGFPDVIIFLKKLLKTTTYRQAIRDLLEIFPLDKRYLVVRALYQQKGRGYSIEDKKIAINCHQVLFTMLDHLGTSKKFDLFIGWLDYDGFIVPYEEYRIEGRIRLSFRLFSLFFAINVEKMLHVYEKVWRTFLRKMIRMARLAKRGYETCLL